MFLYENISSEFATFQFKLCDGTLVLKQVWTQNIITIVFLWKNFMTQNKLNQFYWDKKKTFAVFLGINPLIKTIIYLFDHR